MAVMLGVDIGGTKIAVGAVESDGSLVGDIQEFSSRTESTEAFQKSLVRDLKKARKELGVDPRGVGVGCAGTVDFNRGRIVESPNLPLEDYPMAEIIGGAFDLPVVLDNDANLATLAEVRVGAARSFRYVIMLTLGTGVGGGIVLDGSLYRGANGSAAELGHTIVKGDDEPCLCGRKGCLEMYASGKALERFARKIVEGERPEPVVDYGPSATAEAAEQYGRALAELERRGELDGRRVGELAREGDAAARDAVAEVAQWLGAGLANLANIFNPEMIVIGGGLGELGELLLDPARQVMRASAIRPNGEVAKVAGASLGNDAGVIGAGLVAWEELKGE